MSAGVGQREVEVEMEEINQELGSSPPLPPPHQDPLPLVGPLLHPLGPTAEEQKRSACKEIAP